MILFSHAKINVGLHILRKRDDGFHDIATLMIPIPFSDIIELNATATNKDFSLEQSGITIPGKQEDNLCYRSWKLFTDTAGPLPVKMHLHKQIPTGAGLGGGSSNAATVLKGLNTLSGHKLNDRELHQLAARLGSDCSLFIENRPAMATGRGEILETAKTDLSGYHLVLLHPGVTVNTTWAYANIRPSEKRDRLDHLLAQPIQTWKTKVVNDFEPTIFEAYPAIAGLKADLYLAGAVYTSMSGSGSAVYGLFEKEPELEPELKKQLLWSGWI